MEGYSKQTVRTIEKYILSHENDIVKNVNDFGELKEVLREVNDNTIHRLSDLSFLSEAQKLMNDQSVPKSDRSVAITDDSSTTIYKSGEASSIYQKGSIFDPDNRYDCLER